MLVVLAATLTPTLSPIIAKLLFASLLTRLSALSNKDLKMVDTPKGLVESEATSCFAISGDKVGVKSFTLC